ncbi:MAG: VPLPA-CTERM sorting domain-containing protein [Parvularculaceae bacterium]
MAAQSASANVISIDGTAATVTCTLSCEAFTLGGSPGAPTGLGTLSGSDADPYGLANSGEATEIAALNTLAGTSFTTADHNKDQVGEGSLSSCSGDLCSFMTTALYFILKIDGFHTFFKNTSGGEVTITFDKNDVPSFGLSHVSTIDVVPLPAAFWLMGAGLAGLGFARGRKKAA